MFAVLKFTNGVFMAAIVLINGNLSPATTSSVLDDTASVLGDTNSELIEARTTAAAASSSAFSSQSSSSSSSSSSSTSSGLSGVAIAVLSSVAPNTTNTETPGGTDGAESSDGKEKTDDEYVEDFLKDASTEGDSTSTLVGTESEPTTPIRFHQDDSVAEDSDNSSSSSSSFSSTSSTNNDTVPEGSENNPQSNSIPVSTNSDDEDNKPGATNLVLPPLLDNSFSNSSSFSSFSGSAFSDNIAARNFRIPSFPDPITNNSSNNSDSSSSSDSTNDTTHIPVGTSPVVTQFSSSNSGSDSGAGALSASGGGVKTKSSSSSTSMDSQPSKCSMQALTNAFWDCLYAKKTHKD
jgi:hypothetical protein